jgi:hypothetical protein
VGLAEILLNQPTIRQNNSLKNHLKAARNGYK